MRSRYTSAHESQSDERSGLANRESSGIFPAMTRLRRVLVLPVLAAGCYRYAAVEPTGIAPASDVRLDLTAAGASALVPTLGQSTTAVEGKILRVTDSTYVLGVSSTLKRAEDDETSFTRTVWAGESVSIPRSAVAGVELRSLDRRRTIMAASLVTVLGVLAAEVIVHGIGSGGSMPDGPPVITP